MRAHSGAALWDSGSAGMIKNLMPFLYDTRTLTSIRHSRNIVPHFHQYVANSRRCIHDSYIPVSSIGRPPKSDSRVYKPSKSYNRDAGSFERQNGDSIPWDDTPGPMEEGGRSFITISPGVSVQDGDDFDDMNFSQESDPFADDDILDDSPNESPTSSEPTVRPVRESTITITERHAFERIFADIMARSKSSDIGEAPSSPSNNQDTVLTKQSARQRNVKLSLQNIMDEATRTESSRQAKTLESQLGAKTQEELMADVDQYPVPLRAAAAMALGLVSATSIESGQDESTSNADELENIRQPERDRVESLMRAATTDVELWQVMEMEVFALIGKLGLEENPKVQDNSTKTRARKRKETSETAGNNVTIATGSDQPLDLNLYGPLYPSHVLLGLRLLDRSFAKPSPLVLNVLPRIKSLGIISHVLGASTSFYNELLRIYWLRYDNFRGVFNLLKEMDQAGLEFDEGTLNTVEEINMEQLKVKRGDRGSVLQALWSMPEFAPGKFRSWKNKIRALIEERKTEIPDDVAWRI